MILGAVNDELDPIVRLLVVGPDGSGESVDWVVDTGFAGTLSLPYDVIRRLNLRWSHEGASILADGSTVRHDVYCGFVDWFGELYLVDIDAADADPLLGTSLLNHHRLTIDVHPGGPVNIAPLP